VKNQSVARKVKAIRMMAARVVNLHSNACLSVCKVNMPMNHAAVSAGHVPDTVHVFSLYVFATLFASRQV
jgi:hypothetical protein